MKYTIRPFIVLILLLCTLTLSAATNDNIYTRKTTTSASRWSPVSSDINVRYSGNRNNVDFTTRRPFNNTWVSGGPSVTRSSYSTNRTVTNTSIRENSIAPRSKTRNFINYNSIDNPNIISNSGDFFFAEEMTGDDDEDRRPGRSNIRRGSSPSDGYDGDGTTPGTKLPLTDAVPCQVVMILAVAVIKYRKLH